ncbi:hypothetical protein WA171_007206 [Blastocystis sp. BT1]
MEESGVFESNGECTGLRWLVPMDFSIQATACFEWVLKIMKPVDSLLVLNVLNLKTPTYAHDVVVNDRLKKESQEHLDEMKKTANDKGFQNVEVVCARGDPVVCSYAVEKKIDTIVMGRRGMGNVERLINGSVSTYVLANAPCAVCIMGKAIEDRVVEEQQRKEDKALRETLESSDSENEGKKMPFFLPRKNSAKDYYTDSD